MTTLLVNTDTATTVTSSRYLNKRMSFITMRLHSVDCGRTNSSNHVQTMRRCNHMSITRSYARSISARMVKFQPLWDRSHHELVDNSVRSEKRFPITLYSVSPDEAVASVVEHSFPQPTSFRLCELVPAFSQGLSLRSRHTSMVSQLEVI
jgi:hypothetical protein